MSVAAKRVDLSFMERDELVVEFEVKDLTGVVVDITGGTVHWGLATLATDETLLAEKTGAGEAEVSNGPLGLIEVTIDAPVTAARDGIYHHRVKLTLGGQTETVAWGEFVVCPTPA